MKKPSNLFIGIIFSIIFAGTIIFSLENELSFLQIFTGYIVFIIPFTFISSFKSKLPVFILSFLSILVFYIVIKFDFFDFFIGFGLALISGLSLHYFKISKTKIFNK
jgi:hypothetical protein|tara:strand:+ start:75 stop:395 length:321 start_codon:yes stop_codon:yes gene_type:complete